MLCDRNLRQPLRVVTLLQIVMTFYNLKFSVEIHQCNNIQTDNDILLYFISVEGNRA